MVGGLGLQKKNDQEMQEESRTIKTKRDLLGGSSMTCKWLITMVIVSPLSRVVGPLPNGL